MGESKLGAFITEIPNKATKLLCGVRKPCVTRVDFTTNFDGLYTLFQKQHQPSKIICQLIQTIRISLQLNCTKSRKQAKQITETRLLNIQIVLFHWLATANIGVSNKVNKQEELNVKI